MFEHMAFKGTPNIGTTDYKAEARALQEMEAAYQAWQAERLKLNPDMEKMSQLEARFKEKQDAADKFVVKNEFGDIIDREGGAGLNAFTNSDVTGSY
jgi:predicted Zn-dependent peptidase